MFIFDLNKSRINQKKHGISFGEAKKLWRDPNLIEYASGYVGEARFSVTGFIDEKLWTAIVTYREDSTRIISVRRARKHEKKVYFSRGV